MLGSVLGGSVAGVLMFLGVVPLALIIRYVWPLRRQPGVVWFLLSMGVGITWELLAGLNLLIDDLVFSILLYNITELVLGVGAICWLLLAIEYTTDTVLSVRAFVVFAFVPIVYGAGLLLNPDLLYTVESGGGAWTLRFEPEPVWFVLTGYNYLLAAFSSGLWIGELFTSDGTRRRQATLFLFSTVILFSAGILFSMVNTGVVEQSGIVVFGPIALLTVSGTIAYALTEYQLFQFEPVAREAVVRGMDDGVVILDDRGRVVDTNPAARALFEIDDLAAETTNPKARTLFEDYPGLVAQLDADDEIRTELTLTFDGVERDVDLNITVIEYGRGSTGKAVVLRDITSLKQRQRDLTLLKRVLTRVFRHNVRNDMTAIRGYAEMIELQAEGELAEHASEILGQSDELIEQSRKTRLIAKVVDAEDAVVATDLGTVVDEAVERYRSEYPAATITSSIPDGTTVRTHRSLGLAIEQLLENAIVHDPGEPTVTITLERIDSRVGIVIEDTGPGIPDFEIEALFRGTESDLEHASGVGLWLANWIADYSGGELTLDNTDVGARVTIWLQPIEAV